jgi:hypothetical protein
MFAAEEVPWNCFRDGNLLPNSAQAGSAQQHCSIITMVCSTPGGYRPVQDDGLTGLTGVSGPEDFLEGMLPALPSL